MWPAVNGNAKPAMKPSATERSHSWAGLSCPECEERSYLRMLVAELLYRNQVLRFDLIEARDQVERIERAGSYRRGDNGGN
jgi:type II secretory ATPase GspE/PulE/Tfp pilus assembly ATPase PilB-like protein